MLLEGLLPELLFSVVPVGAALMLKLILDFSEPASVLFLLLTAIFFELQIALDPALHFLVFFNALLTAVVLLATADVGLVLSVAYLLDDLIALSPAVIDDTVAPQSAFVNTAFQRRVTKKRASVTVSKHFGC